MRFTWRVEDGYVNNGPHEVEVPDDELAACNTADEREELINSYVEEEFVNNITWTVDDYDGVE